MKLYHGSPIKKEVLIPRKANGISKKADRQVGVYASNKKDRAIAMALIHLKGIYGPSRLNFPKGGVIGTVYYGWPKQKYLYLYTIDSKNFKKIDSWQWITHKELKPIKIEKLKVKDFIYMIRKGTEKERKIIEERIRRLEKKIS